MNARYRAPSAPACPVTASPDARIDGITLPCHGGVHNYRGRLNGRICVNERDRRHGRPRLGPPSVAVASAVRREGSGGHLMSRPVRDRACIGQLLAGSAAVMLAFAASTFAQA